MNDNPEGICQAFKDLVNMRRKEVEDWLDTDKSKSVGHSHDREGESVGHQSGKKILQIKHTNKAGLTDE